MAKDSCGNVDIFESEAFYYIKRLLSEYLYLYEQKVYCVVEDLEKSESSDDLTYYIQKLNNMYLLAVPNIVNDVWSRFRYKLRGLGVRKKDLEAFIAGKLSEIHIKAVQMAIRQARLLGQRLGLESATVSLGLSLIGPTIQISFTFKI